MNKLLTNKQTAIATREKELKPKAAGWQIIDIGYVKGAWLPAEKIGGLW